MTTTEPSRNKTSPSFPGEGTVRRVRFVSLAEAGQAVLREFADPAPHKAVCAVATPEWSAKNTEAALIDGIDILTVSSQTSEHPGLSEDLFKWVADGGPSGAAPPTTVVVHGAQIIWGSSRAAILAAPDRAESFLLALIDFCYYENELRKIEREVGEAWPLLEADSPLAHAVTASDPDRFEDIARRMAETLKRRMRLARIVPHLYQPRPHLPPLANQLIERLRERAHVEDRHEALVSQLDVFERIYEMNSQRISDFKAAQHQTTLEWVIIVLLAAEGVLLLIELLWTLGV